MRILHVDLGREMRGGQWQALRLACGLNAAGIETRLMVRRGSELEREARSSGVSVTRLSLAGLWRASSEFDLVHAHDARSHSLAAFVGGAPLIVARRVAFPVGRSLMSKWKYSRAAYFVAVSEFVKRRLVEAGVEEARVSVVYDGVDMPDQIAEPEVPPRVVAMETSDPRKGCALAREAAERAGVRIEFTREPAKALPGAAMFVYLTQEEGLGSAALMAMAAGAPVIASRTGGLVEAVEDGVTGLLTENTVDRVAEAIGRLLANPEDARKMGLRGRARVAGRFTTATMVEKTIEVYRKVLG